MSSGKGYFNMGYLLSVIFALIPVTNVIFGIIARIEKGNILGAVLNIFLAPLFYIVDLLTIVFSGKLTFLA